MYKEDTGNRKMPESLAHNLYSCQVGDKPHSIARWMASIDMSAGLNVALWNGTRRYL